jgi:DNA replication licensing factor MCM6
MIAGRYDKTKTLRQNVNISAPIMSRFDLFVVVLDEGDELVDYNIAPHIVNIHQVIHSFISFYFACFI